jgi:hypothetical protein
MRALLRRTAPLALLLVACVTTPRPEEVLATGFRTPEQTFRTLQVGVRGELPGLEYACLSTGFRARYGLGQLAYREFRDRVLEHELAFWLGIPAAELVREVPVAADRVRLECRSHGTEFTLELVREDFWQVWTGSELLADEPLEPGEFEQQAEVLAEGDRQVVVSGYGLLPSSALPSGPEELGERLTEFRIGREWKIDRISGLDRP